MSFYNDPNVQVSQDPNMAQARQTMVPSEFATYSGDMNVFAAARRFAWVSGVKKNDSFVYYAMANTSNGTVTFYLTDNGLSTGNAVYTHVFGDTITITPYGTAAYQVASPVVSSDLKSVTANITQVTSAVAGLLSFSSAANNVRCTLIVLGDSQ